MLPERERGAALLTVLLLVAVIAVIAGAALERLTLTTRLTANAVAGQATEGYARAAETLALTRIDALLGPHRDRVTLAGGWSGRPFGLPLPGGGTAVARVADGGNCFNLNSLVVVSGPGIYASYPAARVQFAKLMRLVGIAPQVAETVAASAADWIDTDADRQAAGAEDPDYLSLTAPYRTAGTLMADPSELRAVNGVTADAYARLRPWVCALPVAEPARVNVNTVSPEQAPLLVAASTADTVSVQAVRQAILRRPPAGYATADAFWLQVAQGGAPAGLGTTAAAATTTQWFALTVNVALGPAARHETGLVDARRLPAQLVARQWGEGT